MPYELFLIWHNLRSLPISKILHDKVVKYSHVRRNAT
jgi:hypothetical protein